MSQPTSTEAEALANMLTQRLKVELDSFRDGIDERLTGIEERLTRVEARN